MSYLEQLGIAQVNGVGSAGEVASLSPADGKPIARVRTQTRAEYDAVVDLASEAFSSWRMVPAPKRGEMVREMGNALREQKAALGATSPISRWGFRGSYTAIRCTANGRGTGCTNSGIRWDRWG